MAKPGVAVRFQAPALADFASEEVGELGFRQGDLLWVLATEAPEGWYIARNAEGAEGLIPETYVEPPPLDEPSLPAPATAAFDPFRAATIEMRAQLAGGQVKNISAKALELVPLPMPEENTRGRMLAGFEAEEEGELSVPAGSNVVIVSRVGVPEGWVLASFGKQSGLLPATYVAEFTPEMEAEEEAERVEAERVEAKRVVVEEAEREAVQVALRKAEEEREQREEAEKKAERVAVEKAGVKAAEKAKREAEEEAAALERREAEAAKAATEMAEAHAKETKAGEAEAVADVGVVQTGEDALAVPDVQATDASLASSAVPPVGAAEALVTPTAIDALQPAARDNVLVTPEDGDQGPDVQAEDASLSTGAAVVSAGVAGALATPLVGDDAPLLAAGTDAPPNDGDQGPETAVAPQSKYETPAIGQSEHRTSAEGQSAGETATSEQVPQSLDQTLPAELVGDAAIAGHSEYEIPARGATIAQQSEHGTPAAGQSWDQTPPAGQTWDTTPAAGQSEDRTPAIGRSGDETPFMAQTWDATPIMGRSEYATTAPSQYGGQTPFAGPSENDSVTPAAYSVGAFASPPDDGSRETASRDTSASAEPSGERFGAAHYESAATNLDSRPLKAAESFGHSRHAVSSEAVASSRESSRGNNSRPGTAGDRLRRAHTTGRPGLMRAAFTAENAHEVSVEEGDLVLIKRRQPKMDIEGWVAVVKDGARGSGIVPDAFVALSQCATLLAGFQSQGESELTAEKGQRLWMLPIQPQDGWAECWVNGKRGLVPSEFLRVEAEGEWVDAAGSGAEGGEEGAVGPRAGVQAGQAAPVAGDWPVAAAKAGQPTADEEGPPAAQVEPSIISAALPAGAAGASGESPDVPVDAWLQTVMRALGEADGAMGLPAVALADFAPETDVEIAISKGEALLILVGLCPPQGWLVALRGTSEGGRPSRGLVPETFVRISPFDAFFNVAHAEGGVRAAVRDVCHVDPERSDADNWWVEGVGVGAGVGHDGAGAGAGSNGAGAGAGSGGEGLVPRALLTPMPKDEVRSQLKEQLKNEAAAAEAAEAEAGTAEEDAEVAAAREEAAAASGAAEAQARAEAEAEEASDAMAIEEARAAAEAASRAAEEAKVASDAEAVEDAKAAADAMAAIAVEAAAEAAASAEARARAEAEARAAADARALEEAKAAADAIAATVADEARAAAAEEEAKLVAEAGAEVKAKEEAEARAAQEAKAASDARKIEEAKAAADAMVAAVAEEARVAAAEAAAAEQARARAEKQAAEARAAEEAKAAADAMATEAAKAAAEAMAATVREAAAETKAKDEAKARAEADVKAAADARAIEDAKAAAEAMAAVMAEAAREAVAAAEAQARAEAEARAASDAKEIEEAISAAEAMAATLTEGKAAVAEATVAIEAVAAGAAAIVAETPAKVAILAQAYLPAVQTPAERASGKAVFTVARGGSRTSDGSADVALASPAERALGASPDTAVAKGSRRSDTGADTALVSSGEAEKVAGALAERAEGEEEDTQKGDAREEYSPGGGNREEKSWDLHAHEEEEHTRELHAGGSDARGEDAREGGGQEGDWQEGDARNEHVRGKAAGEDHARNGDERGEDAYGGHAGTQHAQVEDEAASSRHHATSEPLSGEVAMPVAAGAVAVGNGQRVRFALPEAAAVVHETEAVSRKKGETSPTKKRGGSVTFSAGGSVTPPARGSVAWEESSRANEASVLGEDGGEVARSAASIRDDERFDGNGAAPAIVPKGGGREAAEGAAEATPAAEAAGWNEEEERVGEEDDRMANGKDRGAEVEEKVGEEASTALKGEEARAAAEEVVAGLGATIQAEAEARAEEAHALADSALQDEAEATAQAKVAAEAQAAAQVGVMAAAVVPARVEAPEPCEELFLDKQAAALDSQVRQIEAELERRMQARGGTNSPPPGAMIGARGAEQTLGYEQELDAPAVLPSPRKTSGGGTRPVRPQSAAPVRRKSRPPSPALGGSMPTMSERLVIERPRPGSAGPRLKAPRGGRASPSLTGSAGWYTAEPPTRRGLLHTLPDFEVRPFIPGQGPLSGSPSRLQPAPPPSYKKRMKELLLIYGSPPASSPRPSSRPGTGSRPGSAGEGVNDTPWHSPGSRRDARPQSGRKHSLATEYLPLAWGDAGRRSLPVELHNGAALPGSPYLSSLSSLEGTALGSARRPAAVQSAW
jgi:hypothetical protein